MSRWSIVFDKHGEKKYLRDGRPVPQHVFELNNPSKLQEIVDACTVRIAVSKDCGWEGENNGRGRYIGQLGEESDPKCYHRSRESLKEECRRRQWTWYDA